MSTKETIEENKRQFLDMNKMMCKEVGMEDMWSAVEDLISRSFDKGASIAETVVRQEERERCINIVEGKFFCSRCAITNKKVCKICESRTLLRRALWEGGEG